MVFLEIPMPPVEQYVELFSAYACPEKVELEGKV